MALVTVVACDGNSGEDTSASTDAKVEENKPEWVDYAAQAKLDMSSSTKKLEVTVKQFIDGDTTHFNVPTSVMDSGVFKARYLAINTPESTGQIEEWGKAASNYTKDALKDAVSIVLESDSNKWDADSTGGRYLVWVWYKKASDTDYRNLNLEILQAGLAIASNSANNRYGELCMSAIDQAKAYKLYVYSGESDPDFYYGTAIELTVKELRINSETYLNKTVAFEGVVAKNDGQSIYVEEYDSETGMYHGISVYYGYNLNGMGLSIIKVGNRVRIVGSMQYYEAGGTYQISDLKYDMMNPNAPDNLQKISDGHSGAFTLTDADTFKNGKVTVTVLDENGEEQLRDFDYAHLALNTTISMADLTVVETYTTQNGGDSDGAITLTCKSSDGQTISVRTTVLKDANGNVVTADLFEGKTISVKGIVDFYNGDYQIKVFSFKDIEIK